MRPPAQYDVFRGREGANNQKIMELLSKESLNAYEISSLLGKKYTTIFDRLADLRSRRIVKVVEERIAKKSKRRISFYGLESCGIYAAAFYSPSVTLKQNALSICRKSFSESWIVFSRLYNFDEKRSRIVGDWISSDDGIRSILSLNGDLPLTSRGRILLGFRDLLDFAMSRRTSEVLSNLDVAIWFSEKFGVLEKSKRMYSALGTLAALAHDHSKLRKAYEALKDADAPLIAEVARTEKSRDLNKGDKA